MTSPTEYTRVLAVESAYNVRDLGGYSTADGKTTRWGAFLRADGLHNLSESTKNYLIEYGVRTVIDLRRTRETVETPNALAGVEGIDFFHLNMIGDTDPPGYIPPPQDEWTTPEATADIYRVLLDQRQQVISETLAALANSKGHTAIYHCAAGTDRTGIVSALLLSLAGVPDETVIADYALSAHGLRLKLLVEGIPDGLADHDFNLDEPPEILAPPLAMERTLQHLSNEYGGIESYVRHIGLTDAQIDDIRNMLRE
ncbi:MAG: tyrosine-protein phosphatase [Chloroflexi bacterium]|nr:tyrosine-protein phosphatase [Chloroflexota bacterium]